MGYNPELDWVYKALGISVIRVGVEMPASLDDKSIGRDYFDTVRSAGMELMVDIRCQSSLARQPEAAKEYGAYCELVVSTIPECTEFILWDEPNCPVYSAIGLPSYAFMLRAGYARIKSIRPNALVYNGGLGMHGDTWGIRDFVDAGCLDYTDALNIHPYFYDEDPREVIKSLKDLLRLVSRLEKPPLITEWGVPTAPTPSRLPSAIYQEGVPVHGEDQQAWIVEQALQLFSRFRVELCVLFIWDMVIGSVTHWSQTCGLLKSEATGYQPKEAFYAVKRWRASTH